MTDDVEGEIEDAIEAQLSGGADAYDPSDVPDKELHFTVRADQIEEGDIIQFEVGHEWRENIDGEAMKLMVTDEWQQADGGKGRMMAEDSQDNEYRIESFPEGATLEVYKKGGTKKLAESIGEPTKVADFEEHGPLDRPRSVHAQLSDADISTTFESDEGKVRRIMELDEFEAKVMFLTFPDTGEPMDPPWFAKVLGPDPTGGHNPLWSGSFEAETGAVEAAMERMKQYKREHDRRKRQRSNSRVTDGGIPAAIETAISRRVRPQVVDLPEDEQPPGIMCEPMIEIGMSAQANVGMPDVRLDLEEIISQETGYISSRIFTTTVEGAATHNNFVAYVVPSVAEFWSSLDRGIASLEQRLVEEGYIEDPGRDLSVTLAAGDPHQRVVEHPGAVGRTR